MSNISGLIDAEFTHPHESYTYYYARDPVNVTWVGGTDQVSLIKYCEEQGPEDLTCKRLTVNEKGFLNR